jgi:hypothetical protein
MKSSEFGQTGRKLSVGRSITILLICATLAIGSFAKTAEAKNLPNISATDVQLVTGTDQHGGGSELNSDGKPGDDNLVAQLPARFCYTDFGAYPMVVALPADVPCHVNVPFPPYVLWGITGY